MKLRLREWIQKPEIVFVVLALFFGSLSAFMVPQLSASDENMHFLRAYNLASGKLGNRNCVFPADVNRRAGSVYEGNFRGEYAKKVNFDNTVHKSCGSAASYSPIMHIPQAAGIALAKLIYPSTGLMILFGRLANLLFYAGAIYFIIKRLRLGRWAFAVVGLLPTAIHLAASLSADAVNNVIVLATAAYIINLFVQKPKFSRRQAIELLILASLTALTKTTNLILLLPLAFLPASLFLSNQGHFKGFKQFNVHKWSVVVASGIIGVLSAFLWGKIYGGSLITPAPNDPLASHPIHFLHILFNSYISPFIGYNDIVLRGVIGDFASFRYHLPMFIIFLELLLLVFVLLYQSKNEVNATKIRLPLVIASLSALTLNILAVTLALYISWAIQPYRLGPTALYADGVQGRYFTSILVLLVPVFAWLRQYIKVELRSEVTAGLLVFIISGSSLLFYIYEAYHILIRS